MIDIIIPLYNSFHVAKNCINSALSSKNSVPFRLILVNDASTEILLCQFLENLNDPRVVILVHHQNLGFTKSVNRGLRISHNDVILLNSDTIVSNDWVDRLYYAAYSDDVFATVTPFSNNATICSFPLQCEENTYTFDINISDLDNYFSEINQNKTIEIPTGVGFCLFIKRKCLDQIGLLDEKLFPRGYGEENDFCLRAVKHGWKNILATNIFVFHHGNVSFGSEKQELSIQGLQKLKKRYPHYFSIVGEHICKNPAREARLSVLLSLVAKSTHPTILFVSHSLGGGTEKHVKELAHLLSKNSSIIILRNMYSTPFISISFQVDDKADRILMKMPNELDMLYILLKACRVKHIHYHHLMGASDCIVSLANALDISYDITLHDYFFLLGEPKLTDEGQLNTTYARKIQQNYHFFLKRARLVLSPSLETKRIFTQCFPDINILWAPPPDRVLQKFAQPQNNNQKTFNILIIGILCKYKGSFLLNKVVKILNKSYPHFRFILIGTSNEKLDRRIQVHGKYEDSDLQNLIEKYKGNLIWFPARWAETYSYTLSAALHTSLPILAPNIGAFPERLSEREWAWVTDHKQTIAQYADVLKQCYLAIQYHQRPEIYISNHQKESAWSYQNYLTEMKVSMIPSEYDGQMISKILQKSCCYHVSMRSTSLIFKFHRYCSRISLLAKLWHIMPLRIKNRIKKLIRHSS